MVAIDRALDLWEESRDLGWEISKSEWKQSFVRLVTARERVRLGSDDKDVEALGAMSKSVFLWSGRLVGTTKHCWVERVIVEDEER